MFGRGRSSYDDLKDYQSIRYDRYSGNNRFDKYDNYDKYDFKMDYRNFNSNSMISNSMVNVLGVVMICLTIMISFVAVKTSVNNISAKEMQIAQQNQNTASNSDSSSSSSSSSGSDFSSEQIDWMVKNHITYEFGFPVDESGSVVDDPTTELNEAERAKDIMVGALQQNGNQSNSSSSDTAKAGFWWSDKDFIVEDENGVLYSIVKDDLKFSDMASKAGFDKRELLDYNNIANENDISTGMKIIFPREGPSVFDSDKGLG